MSILNPQAYAVAKDKLIYDSKHPIDAIMVQVAVSSNTAGEFKRGQLLDCADGEYSVHAESGDASAIVQETTSYAADDTSVAVPVYVSGSFRTSEIISAVDLESADIEALRGKGIYLK